MSQELIEIKASHTVTSEFEGIIGNAPKMGLVFNLIKKIQKSEVPILITGESGTGKERIAQAIHGTSPRQKYKFVAENCSALTDTLLESEMFGHVKGSFTGAVDDKKGLFESANRGTIFLDEIGDMSELLQKKLLRVLQENVVRKVGGTSETKIDARLLSATNKNLVQMVKEGTFREDLYYRINVIEIQLPPLRDRKEDIPALTKFFVWQYLNEMKIDDPYYIENDVISTFSNYNWPGNVRELENFVKKLIALADNSTITMDDLAIDPRFG